MEVAWKRSDGDWANLITDLRETLGPIGEETTRYMTEAVGFANEMKEEDIKKLIRKYDGVIPKVNIYCGALIYPHVTFLCDDTLSSFLVEHQAL